MTATFTGSSAIDGTRLRKAQNAVREALHALKLPSVLRDTARYNLTYVAYHSPEKFAVLMDRALHGSEAEQKVASHRIGYRVAYPGRIDDTMTVGMWDDLHELLPLAARIVTVAGLENVSSTPGLIDNAVAYGERHNADRQRQNAHMIASMFMSSRRSPGSEVFLADVDLIASHYERVVALLPELGERGMVDTGTLRSLLENASPSLASGVL